MAEEVFVKYTMRSGRIVLCLFGLVLCMGAAGFGWATLSSTSARHNPEGLIGLGLVGALGALWMLRSLCDGKPFLETSEDGIFVGTTLHCYIPWANVKAIKMRSDAVRYQYATTTVNLLSIELEDPDDIYFDSLSHRLMNQYFMRRAVIDLNPSSATSWSCRRLKEALLERWEREKESPAYKTAGG